MHYSDLSWTHVAAVCAVYRNTQAQFHHVIRDLIIYREIIANPERALPCYCSNNRLSLSLSLSLSTEGQFRFQANAYGIYGEQTGTKIRCFSRTLVFPFHQSFIPIYYPHCVHAILVMEIVVNYTYGAYKTVLPLSVLTYCLVSSC
jgi:hypothetical protein